MDKDPGKNLPRLLDWFDKFDRKDILKTQRETVRNVVMDKDNNWHQLVMSLWNDVDPGVRNRLFENFIINGALLGIQKQKENREKYRGTERDDVSQNPGIPEDEADLYRRFLERRGICGRMCRRRPVLLPYQCHTLWTGLKMPSSP